jgi:hypothetical protein
MPEMTPEDPEKLLAMFDDLDQLVDEEAAAWVAPLPATDLALPAPLDASGAGYEESGWSVPPEGGPSVTIDVDEAPAVAAAPPPLPASRRSSAAKVSVERRTYPDPVPKGTGLTGRVRGSTAHVLAAFRWEA